MKATGPDFLISGDPRIWPVRLCPYPVDMDRQAFSRSKYNAKNIWSFTLNECFAALHWYLGGRRSFLLLLSFPNYLWTLSKTFVLNQFLPPFSNLCFTNQTQSFPPIFKPFDIILSYFFLFPNLWCYHLWIDHQLSKPLIFVSSFLLHVRIRRSLQTRINGNSQIDAFHHILKLWGPRQVVHPCCL